VLKQAELAPLGLTDQVALLVALDEGLLDAVPLERIDACRAAIQARLRDTAAHAHAAIERTGALDPADRAALVAAIRAAIAPAIPGEVA
jgi:F-type H+-transporting ATPase subunit alpha